MKIQIAQPAALYEAGKRPLNEDFIYPLLGDARVEDRFFAVCDGEGGPQAGEEGAKMVAVTFGRYFANVPPEGKVEQIYLDQALDKVERTLTEYKQAHPESAGLSVSAAMLYFDDEEVVVAGLGSCRAFYFRKRDARLLPLDPARDPRQAALRIVGAEQPQRLWMRQIPLSEIGPGDSFVLASDGITEHVDDRSMSTILNNALSSAPDLTLDEIRNIAQKGEDNYACYWIHVQRVAGGEEAPALAPAPAEAAPAEAGLMRNLRYAAFAGVGLLLVLLVAIAWLSSRKSPYDNLMLRAEKSLQQNNYLLALAQYDSALSTATSDAERSEASRAKGKAMAQMNDLAENSPEALIDRANESLRLQSYEKAVENYRRAAELLAQDSSQQQLLPGALMAEALLRYGKQLFQDSARDCERVLEQYDEAFRLAEAPGGKPADSLLLTQARQEADLCRQALAAAGKAQPAPVASAQKPRSVAPAPAAKPAASVAAPATRPDARTRSVAPAGGEARRTAAPAAAPAATSAQKSALKEGKDLYRRARAQNSAYLYKQSAAKLEAAGPALDGEGAYLVAYLLHSGSGVKKNESRALQYAKQSALEGWPAGQYLYAHLLLARGNRADTATAIGSLRQAAAQNYPDAIYRLQQLPR
jgi:protein phosphatase